MSKRTIIHTIAILLFIALLAEQLKDAEGFRNTRRIKFTKGKGSTISIHRGDTVITNIIPNGRHIRPGPYRWHYAVTPHILVHFLPRFKKWMKDVRPTPIDVSSFDNKRIQNRGQKDPDATGLAGSLVGALMLEYGKNQQRIPFDLLRCNCKHYVEYLSLGKVKGSWRHPLYLPVNKKCAVYTALHKSMASQIYHAKSFILTDHAGKPYSLNVEEWPDYILDMIKKNPEYRALVKQP